jgi:hypothetical protein
MYITYCYTYIHAENTCIYWIYLDIHIMTDRFVDFFRHIRAFDQSYGKAPYVTPFEMIYITKQSARDRIQN